MDKVARANYKKYLRKLELTKVRGFRRQVVRFDFPVTALIGPNGGGKTTILGAAACAYEMVKPQQFFAKSGKLDQSMKDWIIEYELVDKGIRKDDVVRRTASFKRQRWNRDALERDTVSIGISRTVPANERVELRRCASTQFSVSRNQVTMITKPVADAVEKILGKDASRYSHVRVDKRGRVSLLAGVTRDGKGYSEFHFGAGESSIIRMVTTIESQPENCLILIEEIENGLHPVATRRMVEYLIEVAHRKRAQAIFTTHSDDALAPLPPAAIWAALDGRVVQGKLSIESLRAITGEVEAECVVFTEDQFAAEWVRSMIRQCEELSHDMVEIHPMQGDGTAVLVNRYHNLDPSNRTKSIAMIDGDSQQVDSASERVFRLPGQSPERYVFDQVQLNLRAVKGKLAVALHLDFDRQDEVESTIADVWRSNRDPHLLFSQVGLRLGFLSEDVVRDAFFFVWASESMDSVKTVLQPVVNLVQSVKANPDGTRKAPRKIRVKTPNRRKGKSKRARGAWGAKFATSDVAKAVADSLRSRSDANLIASILGSRDAWRRYATVLRFAAPRRLTSGEVAMVIRSFGHVADQSNCSKVLRSHEQFLEKDPPEEFGNRVGHRYGLTAEAQATVDGWIEGWSIT